MISADSRKSAATAEIVRRESGKIRRAWALARSDRRHPPTAVGGKSFGPGSPASRRREARGPERLRQGKRGISKIGYIALGRPEPRPARALAGGFAEAKGEGPARRGVRRDRSGALVASRVVAPGRAGTAAVGDWCGRVERSAGARAERRRADRPRSPKVERAEERQRAGPAGGRSAAEPVARQSAADRRGASAEQREQRRGEICNQYRRRGHGPRVRRERSGRRGPWVERRSTAPKCHSWRGAPPAAEWRRPRSDSFAASPSRRGGCFTSKGGLPVKQGGVVSQANVEDTK